MRRLVERQDIARTATGIAAVLLCACVSAGCDLSAEFEGTTNLNACETDGDCASGVCANDGTTSLCVATKADLPNLVLEFNVPTSASILPGARWARGADALGLDLQGSDPSGFVRSIGIEVAPLRDVVATLEVSSLPASCKPLLVNGAVRATLELHPVGYPVGMSLPSYTGAFDEDRGGAVAQVPAGTYDLFLKPEVASAPGCELPPALLKGRAIEHSTELRVQRDEPLTVTGHLDVPQLNDCTKDEATCWTVELLDNQQGRPIGSKAVFSPEGSGTAAGFRLHLWRPSKDSAEGLDPVLVLHPPTELRKSGMPDRFWKLSAIDPDGDLDVRMKVAPLVAALSTSVALEGHVRAPGGSPVPADVLIVSRQLLDGDFGDNALFQAAVHADGEGRFALSVLPGKYEIVAIPGAASTYGITTTTWVVPPGDAEGSRTLEVSPVSRLRGAVRTPAGDPAAALPVQISPSSSAEASLLEASFAPETMMLLASLPRTAAAFTDASGSFELPLDPGRVDLSVRPPPSSNLPWLVHQGISASEAIPQTLDLGDVTVTPPVVLRGVMVTPDGSAVPGVTVRGWLGALEANGKRPSAVGLGEATTDGLGRFRLLLPASVLH